MSIGIEYQGRLGNHLFQYAFARLLADRNKLNLETEFDYQDVIRTMPESQGRSYSSPVIRIDDNFPNWHPNLAEVLDRSLDDGRYILKGSFENSDIFNAYEKEIRSYFELEPVCNDIGTNDIVMHVRMVNMAKAHRNALHPDYYHGILAEEEFDRLYVWTEEANEPYLGYFKTYNPVVVSDTVAHDFHFIRSANKIICANSTFSWWAAYLSDAKSIYTPTLFICPNLRACRHSVCIETISKP